jgi:hypothetical protein
VLDRCGGNKREASRILGISYHTLIAYLRYRARSPEAQPNAAAVSESSSLEGVHVETAEPVRLEVAAVGAEEDDIGVT